MTDKEYLTRHVESLEKNLRHYNCTESNTKIDNSKTSYLFGKNKLPDGSKLCACYTIDRDGQARQRLRNKLLQRQRNKIS